MGKGGGRGTLTCPPTFVSTEKREREKRLAYPLYRVPVMEVAAGEYGEDKVKQLMSAVADGHCEPFQEEFERQHSSGATTPSDHSSCVGEDDGDDSCAEKKALVTSVNSCCNGDPSNEMLKNGMCLGSEVRRLILWIPSALSSTGI